MLLKAAILLGLYGFAAITACSRQSPEGPRSSLGRRRATSDERLSALGSRICALVGRPRTRFVRTVRMRNADPADYVIRNTCTYKVGISTSYVAQGGTRAEKEALALALRAARLARLAQKPQQSAVAILNTHNIQ
jgi:hypothetical protein